MSQIITAENWTVGEQVTDVKLDNILASATIGAELITVQAALTAAGSDPAADYILVYDASAGMLAKMVLNQFPAVAGAKPNPPFITLTDGAIITMTNDSAKVVQNAKVTIAGNRSLEFASTTAGMTGVIIVKQDATGGRTLHLPGNSLIPGVGVVGGLFADLNTTGGRETACAWVFNGVNLYWTFTKY